MADDGPLIVVFGSSHQQNKNIKKKLVIVGPPLTKFSGPALVNYDVKTSHWYSNFVRKKELVW